MAVPLQSRTKQPRDQYTFGIDYYDRLPVNNPSIVSALAEAIDLTDSTDVTSAIVGNPVCQVTETMVLVVLKAGVPGKSYKITILASLSDGNLLEDDFILNVEDR